VTRFAVVLVSYNTGELLAKCLTSVLAQTTAEDTVAVVDNASSDGSAGLVRERFPSVKLIANHENRGFGAANNQAIQATEGDYVLLVNPDCEVGPGSLDGFQRFMETHPRAAVAGGRLRYADGAFQHSSFRFPSLFQVYLDFFPLNWRLTESRLNGRYPKEDDERAFQIDHPLGAFMCVRRAAAEEVGLFDEGFFMYAEEVDWCFRFKRAGWEVWHCPDALAVHHGGQSTRQRAAAMFVELHRSRMRLYRKHYPAWFRAGARALTTLGMIRLFLRDLRLGLRTGGIDAEGKRRLDAYLKVAHL
jgi:N-acetylglucosaminyl-diphospho-decaprenol L-rhamnosyltransferase